MIIFAHLTIHTIYNSCIPDILKNRTLVQDAVLFSVSFVF